MTTFTAYTSTDNHSYQLLISHFWFGLISRKCERRLQQRNVSEHGCTHGCTIASPPTPSFNLPFTVITKLILTHLWTHLSSYTLHVKYDNSGKLGFDEFFILLRLVAKWKSVYETFDKDFDGVFDSYELRDALTHIGTSIIRVLNLPGWSRSLHVFYKL